MALNNTSISNENTQVVPKIGLQRARLREIFRWRATQRSLEFARFEGAKTISGAYFSKTGR